MERQQEHPGKKQQFDTRHTPPTPSLQKQKEKQQGKETDASIAQSKALSSEDHTRVEELAYALYEQRGRKDGHDLEDWLNAEQRIMAHGRSSRSS
jgi:hypothetical protein